MKKKFVVRKTENSGGGKTWISWDIALKSNDGMEWIGEFHSRYWAIKAAKALNRR